ncbi:uncharacterized protein LOC122363239 [Amphibalanus amphitrite]|uniref:uncharacterized protein LOC122363239 n=1 Tax=Amphibalanus amphitrite TaxID=1232801 RepID=UPI001C8FA84A|nr:uncharacterized protein LOC122363239 [Amphibalanus amphitrite]
MATHPAQLLLVLLAVTLLPLCSPSVIRRPAVSSAGAINPSAKDTVIVLPDPNTTPAPMDARSGAARGSERRPATADGPRPDREARIINYQSDNYQDGYHFQRCGTVYLPGSRRIPPGTSARRFETTNGIKHEEVGQVFSGPLPLTGVISTEGRVSWHDPAGVHIVLYWHADENGYQPLGIKMVKHQQPPEEKRNIEQDFKMLQAMRENKLNVHDKESGISILDEKDRVNARSSIDNPSDLDIIENSVEAEALVESSNDLPDLSKNAVGSGGLKEHNAGFENTVDASGLAEATENSLEKTATLSAPLPELQTPDKQPSVSQVTEGRDEVKPSVGDDLTEASASDAESLQDRRKGPLEPLQNLEASPIGSLQVLEERQAEPLQDLGDNQLAEPLPGQLESSPDRLRGLEDEPLEPLEDPRARPLEPPQGLEAGPLETPRSVESRPMKSLQDLGTPLTEPMSDGALLKLVALTDISGVPSGKYRKRKVRKVIRRRIIKL